MKLKSQTLVAVRRLAVRSATAKWAAFATACLFVGSAATLFAAPAAEEKPVTAYYAVYQQITPSLEPSIDDLRKEVDKPVVVTFTIMAVGGRSNLYLNSLKEWRDPDCFTAALSPEAIEELKKLGTDDPFDDLIGRRVRCQGTLEVDGDRVRIQVKDVAKQLELLGPESSDTDTAAEKPESAPASEASSKSETTAADVSIPSSPDEPFVHPSIEELRGSIGKESVVMFRVLNAGGRTHLYINSQKDYRRPDCFTAQVEPDAVAGLASLGLEDPGTELIGKLLECRGTLRLDNDRVNIVVTDVEKQLKLVDEPSEAPAAEAKPAETTTATP